MVLLVYGIITFIYHISPIYGDSNIAGLDRWILITLPFLDMILVTTTIYLFASYTGGKLEIAWVLLVLSSFSFAVGDTLWAHEYWKKSYNSFSLSNDIFTWSYLFSVLFAVFLIEILSTSK